MKEKALIIIPARMASTRFPNKPMALIRGKTMIERVWQIGQMAGETVIATDDERLREFALGFGAKVVMTSSDCLTGTDRVAEASSHFPDHTIFFSLQGDAVLTPPWVIQKVLNEMIQHSSVQMATPAVKLRGKSLADFVASKRGGSSSGTVVVFNKMGDALYFSKALIPFERNEMNPERTLYRHIGLYGYRRETLLRFSELEEGTLEKSEKLEQLRALENGIPIRVVEVDYQGRTHGSVDRPEDVRVVEEVIEREGELV